MCVVMSIDNLRSSLLRLFRYVFDQKHIDAWFKWLGWVIATAAIGYAWWQTRSHLVLPFVIISFAYIWVTANQGLGFFLAPIFKKWRWSRDSAFSLMYLISGFFTLYAFVALVILFIGLFKT